VPSHGLDTSGYELALSDSGDMTHASVENVGYNLSVGVGSQVVAVATAIAVEVGVIARVGGIVPGVVVVAAAVDGASTAVSVIIQ
jgi:hypothetical protein